MSYIPQSGSEGSNEVKKQTPKDFSAVPLCREHHSDYHAMGLKEFNNHWRIDCWKEAFKLVRRYFID